MRNTTQKIRIGKRMYAIDQKLSLPRDGNNVFKCRDLERKRDVTIKRFNGTNSALALEAYEIWQQERPRLLALGLPDIHFCNEEFQVSDYVPGHDIETSYYEAKIDLTISSIHQFVSDVVPMIGGMMEIGVVHSDLKPTNFILHQDSDGALQPQIIDFSSMHRPDRPSRSGTREHASPEQISGESTPHADVFGLGMTTIATLAMAYPNEVGMEEHGYLFGIPSDDEDPDREAKIFQARVDGSWYHPEARDIFQERLSPITGQCRTQLEQILDFSFACIRPRAEDRPQNTREMMGLLTGVIYLTT